VKRLLASAALLWAVSASAQVPVQEVTIVRAYPHDPHAFTEGLIYRDGRLFESTGFAGRSTIREVRLRDGRVLRTLALPPDLFGEGIVDWGDELISVTWRSGVGFRWNRAAFRKLGEFHYSGEGWGLTRSAREIVMSDGTPVLRFLDPKTLKERSRLTVTLDGQPLGNLNELEWVKGEILANVWLTNMIVRIDPKSGKVIARLDLSGLARDAGRGGEDDVLNGIAYDAVRDRLFVTGKNWPKLYEIRLSPLPHR
jgi:glutaminyl-peptide cyclotransferase